MIFVDHQIEDAQRSGRIHIYPFDFSCVSPSSYDFHLGRTFKVFDHQVEVIDPFSDKKVMIEVDVAEGSYFVLHPGQFALASSVERFFFAPNMAGQVNGKSSLGRLGLQIHATAGFFDPGFEGTATLELSNVAPMPVRLYPGMKIAQMVFMPCSAAAERPYGSPKLGSKYVGQSGPTESRYHENPV